MDPHGEVRSRVALLCKGRGEWTHQGRHPFAGGIHEYANACATLGERQTLHLDAKAARVLNDVLFLLHVSERDVVIGRRSVLLLWVRRWSGRLTATNSSRPARIVLLLGLALILGFRFEGQGKELFAGLPVILPPSIDPNTLSVDDTVSGFMGIVVRLSGLRIRPRSAILVLTEGSGEVAVLMLFSHF